MTLTKRSCFGVLAFFALAYATPGGNAGNDPVPDQDKQRLTAGKELFTREWLQGDKRSYAGDGLGPVFNARSCLACHNQGGVGGAGGKQANATLVSAFVTRDPIHRGMLVSAETRPKGILATFFPSIAQNLDSVKPLKQPDRAKLAEIHPALRTANSFPLHRFGVDKEFTNWRLDLFGDPLGDSDLETGIFSFLNESPNVPGFPHTKKVGDATVELVLSERNTPALFGVGLIDQILDRVLEEVAAEQAKAAKARPLDKPSSPDSLMKGQAALPLAGRAARLKDGRIGRFGWKANVATLREFTLQACSNEIGLEVPGFPRAVPAWKKNYKAPGLDLSAEQCDQLIHFVAFLLPPASRPPETPQHATEIAAGKKHFGEIGCATCHRPKLGNVDGIYSDLLLHDMGQLLSDDGAYGTSIQGVASGDMLPLPTRSENTPPEAREKLPKFGAGSREWRTPPLWGLRDSAPYLHDGRANTVADAVANHGGEGLPAAEAFFALSQRERQQVELFLQSLAAPAN
jgi:CxxC motif-containing protein (DUF1111 family)